MRMIVTHKTSIVCKCPISNHSDYYVAEFKTTKLIQVENIAEAIQKHTRSPIFQEHLTKNLAEELQCEVTTAGRHGDFTTGCAVTID